MRHNYQGKNIPASSNNFHCKNEIFPQAELLDPPGTGTGTGFEYYDYIPIPTQQNIDPQDGIDVQAIIDGKMSEEVLASISSCREKPRRMGIIRQIAVKDGGLRIRKFNSHSSMFKDITKFTNSSIITRAERIHS